MLRRINEQCTNENALPEGALRVQPGLNSLSKAVKAAKEQGIGSLYLLSGVHDEVFGATVNLDGSLYVRVDRIGSETALSSIIKLVEDAQMSKAPIQAFADKISGIFAPTVCAINDHPMVSISKAKRASIAYMESTVVDISIPPSSFKPVSLPSSRSPLF